MAENMVARDGIEPPTPAFSGLLTDYAKWFKRNANCSIEMVWTPEGFKTSWDIVVSFRLFGVPVLFPLYLKSADLTGEGPARS